MNQSVTLSFSEIAAALTIVAMLGSVLVWALSTRFASKKLVYLLRDKDQAELALRRTWVDQQLEHVRQRAEEAHARHELAKAPFENLASTLREVKDGIHKITEAAAVRDERFLEILAGLDKRLTIVEARKRR